MTSKTVNSAELLNIADWITRGCDPQWAAKELRILAERVAAETKADAGFQEAFWQIAELLDLPAMPISPKEAFETVMLPRLRELVAQKTP